MESMPWWILSVAWLAGSAAICGAVLVYAIRNRAAKPKAARLVFIALGVKLLQWLSILAQSFVFADSMDLIEYNGDGPDWMNPHLVYTVLMQLFYAASEISIWSLLAWAALMRPDDAGRRL